MLRTLCCCIPSTNVVRECASGLDSESAAERTSLVTERTSYDSATTTAAQSSSVAALRDRLEKRGSSKQEAQDGSKRVPKKRVSLVIDSARCCACDKNVYAAEESKFRGRSYHRNCFKCSVCSCKLDNAELDEQTQSLYCQRCFKRRDQVEGGQVKGGIAGSKTTIDKDEQGDIKHVQEAIGEQLEAALEGMVPRCEICSTTFSARQDVVVNGNLKYHKECMSAGRACFTHDSDGGGGSSMLPRSAAKYVPDRLVIKVLVNVKSVTSV
jgi:hypothetical protein